MNESINNEIEKIFKEFNKSFFNDSLPMPLFKIGNNMFTTINTNIVAKNKNKYSHEITLPRRCLNESIDIIAMYILEGMIREYAYINEIRLFSRRGQYGNKKFKDVIEKCGCSAIDTKEKHGWIIETNDRFKRYCEEKGFKKTWGKIYEYHKGKKGNSIKWICPCCGAIVRSTRILNIVCGDCNETFIKDE